MNNIESIYEQYIGNGTFGIDFEKKHILEAMDAYANHKIKELVELIEKASEATSWNFQLMQDEMKKAINQPKKNKQ